MYFIIYLKNKKINKTVHVPGKKIKNTINKDKRNDLSGFFESCITLSLILLKSFLIILYKSIVLISE